MTPTLRVSVGTDVLQRCAMAIMNSLKPISLHSRTRRLVVMALLTCGWVLLTATMSPAQFSLPEGVGGADGLSPPPAVTRLGSIEVAAVHSPITGDVLFEVAAPTVYDRSTLANIPANAVERRAEEVNARIQRAVLRRRDPPMDLATLTVGLAKLNDVDVIVTRDEHYTQPLVLVTVTESDADYQGVPIQELGEDWTEILSEELRNGIQQLSPEQFRRDAWQAIAVLLGLITITGIVAALKFWVRRHQRHLHKRKKALSTPPSVDVPVDPQQTSMASPSPGQQNIQNRTHFLEHLNEVWTLDRRLNFLGFLQWLLFWLVVLVWYLGIYQLFRQFPYLERFSAGLVGKPIQLLGVWFVTGLVIRIMRRLIDRFTTEREGFDFGDLLTFGDLQRRQLRISTIAGAAKGLITILLMSIGLLLALSVLGVPTGSVVAIGGIFGLAVSFGSQSLVKDLVNGFLILAEDQFAIGDVIDLGDAAGLVENLNLRVTQLRSSDGELVTIPNSAISQVKNLTRSWSRVNFSIDVAYQTDPAKALQILKELSQVFYNDPAWQDKMLAPPDVLGIDEVSHRGMAITIWIQTKPLQQWAVGREYRLRVRQALAEHGIDIGTPRQTYALAPGAMQRNGQHPAADSEAIAPS
ncbi:mechanosensitive ion channel family protein [Halomicronema sp. CCY15110]|uniref:mechanosensitive ion channel family protein n=1 Tax=Halomicronema sp. CCY15110 TaxID=2767773 RepID=UPI001EF39C30|nr:mechanosensitive ion channel family protein [Halomicronema sp. CCY15110]